MFIIPVLGLRLQASVHTLNPVHTNALIILLAKCQLDQSPGYAKRTLHRIPQRMQLTKPLPDLRRMCCSSPRTPPRRQSKPVQPQRSNSPGMRFPPDYVQGLALPRRMHDTLRPLHNASLAATDIPKARPTNTDVSDMAATSEARTHDALPAVGEEEEWQRARETAVSITRQTFSGKVTSQLRRTSNSRWRSSHKPG